MQCEMCGVSAPLLRAIIEGTQMSVCKSCAKYGKVLRPTGPAFNKPTSLKPSGAASSALAQRKPDAELVEFVSPDCGALIKKRREALGLKQAELALKIAEKESLIHNIESGHFIPCIELAKKLERFLKIRIIEQHEEVAGVISKAKRDTLTLGDFVNIKKRS